MRRFPKIAFSVLLVLAFVGILTRPLRMRRFAWRTAIARQHLTTRPVVIGLLPSSVTVFEGKSYVHEFTIPPDASNARFSGEFTVEPRPQGHVNMLLVTAEGLQDRTATRGVSDRSEVLYHVNDTLAENFEINLTPGTYDVIFEYSGSGGEQIDHYGGDGVGARNREVRSRIALSYDLPSED